MIRIQDKVVNIEHFPDGTQRIKIDTETLGNAARIFWFYDREEELSALIYIVRHLKNIGVTSLDLEMPYLPNARMDRIHSKDEVFTLKSFADVINWLAFDSVTILDVHSDVGSALINRRIIKSPKSYIEHAISEIKKEGKEPVLYFPDAGAAKRYAGLFDNKYCYGEKRRDWDTGKILGLDIRTNGIDLSGETVLMIDDIIAFGGSLHYSALELKKNKAEKIYAYATHTENSIFDKEKGTLLADMEAGIVCRLYTTNSLFRGEHEKITIMEV